MIDEASSDAERGNILIFLGYQVREQSRNKKTRTDKK
jgi:hypothetical protein